MATAIEQARKFFDDFGRAAQGIADALICVMTPLRTIDAAHLQAAVAKMDRDARALRRFRQTMRRLIRRADRVGLAPVAFTFRAWRSSPEHALQNEHHLRRTARELRAGVYGTRMHLIPLHPTWAWLYERAADAVSRYRAEVA